MNNTCSHRGWWCAVLSLWLCHLAAEAQEDIYQGPVPYQFQSQTTGPTSSGAAQSSTPFLGTSALGGPAINRDEYAATGPPIVAWGPFRIFPQLSYSVTYGNGLQPEPGLNSTTVINRIGADLLIKIGHNWAIDYSPSEAFYSNPLFRDTTDQRVVLKGGATNSNWILDFSQSYIDTTQPLVETGTQVEQVAYLTALNADCQLNSHLSLQLGLNQNIRFAQELTTLHEWDTSDWLNYQFERQFGAAIGLTGGYDEVGIGSDMPFEEVEGRLNFEPGNKLILSATGGVEDRQFISPSAPSLVAPIFNASLQYQVLEGTLITLSGSRSVVPSFFGNEVNVVTSASADFRQHIIGQMYFSISGSYVVEPYTSIVPNPLPPPYIGLPTTTYLTEVRTDTRSNLRFTLSTIIRTRLTADIFYLRSDNASSQANFSYNGNQVGLQLNYRF
jgi:hypothetical protein